MESSASQVETRGASLSSMRKMKTRPSHHRTRQRGKAEFPVSMSKHAEELMELAVEAAQSRHLPDFLEQFARRSTRMLRAIWGGGAGHGGRETELHAMAGGAATTEAVANWVILRARARPDDVETRAKPQEVAAGVPVAAE